MRFSFRGNKNVVIRNNITTGSRVDLQTGIGTNRSYLTMKQGYDINIGTPIDSESVRTISLRSDQLEFDGYNRIDIQTSAGTNRSYLWIEKGYDINIATPVSSGNIRTIGLRSDQIRVNAPAVYTKNLIVDGTINGVSGLNIGAKTPIVLQQIGMLI